MRRRLPALVLFLVAFLALSALGACSGVTPLTQGTQATPPVDPRTTEKLTAASTNDLKGKEVVAQDGFRLGTVEEVVPGPSGKPARVVIATGKIAMGSKKVALDAGKLRLSADRKTVVALDTTQADIRDMPAYGETGSSTSKAAGK